MPKLPRPRLPALALALIPFVLSSPLASPPARAGLLRPVLEVMRPQLERRLTQVCVEGLAGAVSELAAPLQAPCRELAGRASRCLVREADARSRGIAVLAELMGRQLGPESERIVKRCLARLVGLPADSLEGVPLQQLARRLGASVPQSPEAPPRR